MARSKYNNFSKQKTVKRFVKFLAVSKDPKAAQAVLKSAPEPVVKSVCNAALNLLEGDIKLTPKQKTVFKKHKAAISILARKGPAISLKRKILTQKGGGFFIPLLISTVLSTLGSALFANK